MFADYISECPKCAEWELRCDNSIVWLDGPDYDTSCEQSPEINRLVGKSTLRFLVARFECRCKGCDFYHSAEKVLDVLPDLNAPEPEEKCSHCHTVWGNGAEKMTDCGGIYHVCSKCWYSQ